MPSYTENGLTLQWEDAVDTAPFGIGVPMRVLVSALPAHPSNVVRAKYSVDDGPELVARGFPMRTDQGTDCQTFAIDLPICPPNSTIQWRPLLSCSGREADPKRGGIPPAHLRMPLRDVVPSAPERIKASPARFPQRLEYLARVTVPLVHPPIPVGMTPDGLRIVFPLGSGGRVQGPRLNGTVEHVGGDWMRIRDDGIGVTAIRAIIRSEDGAILQSEYSGFVDFGSNGQKELAGGGGPKQANLNLTPTYLTADPRWQWLNRLQCVGFGRVTMKTLLVEYDLYAMHSQAAEEN